MVSVYFVHIFKNKSMYLIEIAQASFLSNAGFVREYKIFVIYLYCIFLNVLQYTVYSCSII